MDALAAGSFLTFTVIVVGFGGILAMLFLLCEILGKMQNKKFKAAQKKPPQKTYPNFGKPEPIQTISKIVHEKQKPHLNTKKANPQNKTENNEMQEAKNVEDVQSVPPKANDNKKLKNNDELKKNTPVEPEMMQSNSFVENASIPPQSRDHSFASRIPVHTRTIPAYPLGPAKVFEKWPNGAILENSRTPSSPSVIEKSDREFDIPTSGAANPTLETKEREPVRAYMQKSAIPKPKRNIKPINSNEPTPKDSVAGHSPEMEERKITVQEAKMKPLVEMSKISVPIPGDQKRSFKTVGIAISRISKVQPYPMVPKSSNIGSRENSSPEIKLSNNIPTVATAAPNIKSSVAPDTFTLPTSIFSNATGGLSVTADSLETPQLNTTPNSLETQQLNATPNSVEMEQRSVTPSVQEDDNLPQENSGQFDSEMDLLKQMIAMVEKQKKALSNLQPKLNTFDNHISALNEEKEKVENCALEVKTGWDAEKKTFNEDKERLEAELDKIKSERQKILQNKEDLVGIKNSLDAELKKYKTQFENKKQQNTIS